MNKRRKLNFDGDLGLDKELIKVYNNHIYFYEDINIKTALELNLIIDKLNKQLLCDSINYNQKPLYIFLHINSYGGCIFSTMSIIDTIMRSTIKIVSIVEGCVASGASIISMVCHKRLMCKNAFMLIHQLSSASSGKYEELKDNFISDTNIMNKIYKLYYEHTTMKFNLLKKSLKRDLWWNYDDCLKHGLIDDYYDKNVDLENMIFNKIVRSSNKINKYLK